MSEYKKFISDKENFKIIRKTTIDYPHILKSSNRSAKILNKIAFFSQHVSNSSVKSKQFDIVFKTSIFISTIDDLMDDKRIKFSTKVALSKMLIAITKKIKNENDIKKLLTKSKSNDMLLLKEKDLLKIIAYITKIIITDKNQKSYNLWKNSFEKFIKAMLYEEKNHMTNSIESYLKNARLSIGVSFVLSSYFMTNKINYISLKKLQEPLEDLDIIVRLSNDISTHDIDEKIDAITIIELKNKSPQLYLKKLIEKNLLNLETRLSNIEISEKEKWTKKTIKETANVLILIYKKNFFS
ncbi:hypothetical protein KAI56_02110 [Candidatus Parcubacteria bacterium]|nr:hypothetical protein [Candidatus Parcubacteria bacterium]